MLAPMTVPVILSLRSKEGAGQELLKNDLVGTAEGGRWDFIVWNKVVEVPGREEVVLEVKNEVRTLR